MGVRHDHGEERRFSTSGGAGALYQLYHIGPNLSSSENTPRFCSVYRGASKFPTIKALICEGRCFKYAACVDLTRGDVPALCIPPTAEGAWSSGAAQMLSPTQKEGNVLQRNPPPGLEFGKTSLVLLNMHSDTQRIHNADIFSRTVLQLCQIESFRVGETFPKCSERIGTLQYLQNIN